VSRPCSHGEQAETATITGPSRFALATRSGHWPRGPASTFTWRAAVDAIITAPGPARPVAA